MGSERSHVPRELHETWLRSDPIERFRTWLGEHLDEFTEERDEEIKVDVKRTLNEAMKRAEASPLPEPDEAPRRRLGGARGARHAAPQVAA